MGLQAVREAPSRGWTTNFSRGDLSTAKDVMRCPSLSRMSQERHPYERRTHQEKQQKHFFHPPRKKSEKATSRRGDMSRPWLVSTCHDSRLLVLSVPFKKRSRDLGQNLIRSNIYRKAFFVFVSLFLGLFLFFTSYTPEGVGPLSIALCAAAPVRQPFNLSGRLSPRGYTNWRLPTTFFTENPYMQRRNREKDIPVRPPSLNRLFSCLLSPHTLSSSLEPFSFRHPSLYQKCSLTSIWPLSSFQTEIHPIGLKLPVYRLASLRPLLSFAPPSKRPRRFPSSLLISAAILTRHSLSCCLAPSRSHQAKASPPCRSLTSLLQKRPASFSPLHARYPGFLSPCLSHSSSLKGSHSNVSFPSSLAPIRFAEKKPRRPCLLPLCSLPHRGHVSSSIFLPSLGSPTSTYPTPSPQGGVGAKSFYRGCPLLARNLYSSFFQDEDDEEEGDEDHTDSNEEEEQEEHNSRREEDDRPVTSFLSHKDLSFSQDLPFSDRSRLKPPILSRDFSSHLHPSSQRTPLLPFHLYLSHRLSSARYVEPVLRLVSKYRSRMDDVHGAIALQSLAKIISAYEEEPISHFNHASSLRRKRLGSTSFSSHPPYSSPRKAQEDPERRGTRGSTTMTGTAVGDTHQEEGEEEEDEFDLTQKWKSLVTNEEFLSLLQDLALKLQLRGFSRVIDLAVVPWSLAKLRLYLLPSLRPLVYQLLRAVDVHSDDKAEDRKEEEEQDPHRVSPVFEELLEPNGSCRQKEKNQQTTETAKETLHPHLHLSVPHANASDAVSSSVSLSSCQLGSSGDRSSPMDREESFHAPSLHDKGTNPDSMQEHKAIPSKSLQQGLSQKNKKEGKKKGVSSRRPRDRTLRMLRPSGLAMLVWGASKCRYSNEVFWNVKVTQALLEKAAFLSAQEVSICLYALANLGPLLSPSSSSRATSTSSSATREQPDGDLSSENDTSFRFGSTWGEGDRDERQNERHTDRLPTLQEEDSTRDTTEKSSFEMIGNDKEKKKKKKDDDDEAVRLMTASAGQLPQRGMMNGSYLDQTLEALCRQALRRLSEMSGQGLSNVAWALTKLNRPSLRDCMHQVFEEIAREVRQRAHTFDVQTATILLYAFSRVNCQDRGVLQTLSDLLAHRVRHFRAPNFSMCCWALAKWAVENVHFKRLGESIFTALQEEDSLRSYSQQELIVILWSLVRAVPSSNDTERLARRILIEIKKRNETEKADFRAVDVAMILHACSLAGVTDVELLEYQLRQVMPTLLSTGKCSLAELAWIAASLAHLGVSDQTFLSAAASYFEAKRPEKLDLSTVKFLVSFLFSSVHLLPTLHQDCSATRRLLDLVKSMVMNGPATLSSSHSLPSPFASSSPPSVSFPNELLLSEETRSSSLSVVSTPSSPFGETSTCLETEERLNLNRKERMIKEEEEHFVKQEFIQLPGGSSIHVPFNVFVDALTALVRSGILSADAHPEVSDRILTCVERHMDDLHGAEWIKLDEVIKRLRLSGDPRWRRILSEIPSTLQRRYIAAQEKPPDSRQEEVLRGAADQVEDQEGSFLRNVRDHDEFEIVDEEDIERYYAEGRHSQREEDLQDDIEIDLNDPGGRRDAHGIPEGVDPADVLSVDDFYDLLGKKSASLRGR
ncbi:transmembrane protein [Cystoisospora suis]|uniref:Transmembrane protein n=1 Tax=Cystoisospora suis TaxID=483139 RepID=A0A2C6L2M8_9APIC|nr:transmembrane protein [Cystoisospora suis]